MNSPAKRNPARPAILDNPAANLVERQHLKSSAEFRAFVEQKKTDAERRRADHQAEIDRFESEIQRSAVDHETLAQRLEAEIRSRMALIADEDEVIWRADTMLSLERPRTAPTLGEPAMRDLPPQQPTPEPQL